MNGGWQSISVPQMTKWASGTSSTTKKVNRRREATLKVKIPARLAVLRRTALFLKRQGAMRATGRNAFVFYYKVVLCSTTSIAGVFKALAF